MKRSFTKWALVALLPLTALVVGCGGDDDDNNPGNGGAGGSTAGTNAGGNTTGGKGGSTAGTSNGGDGGTAGTTGGSAGTTGGSAGTTGGTAGTTGGSAGTSPGGGPTTCQATNGYNGCCSADGKTAYYFDGGVQSEECEDDQVCTWSAEGKFYTCGKGPATTDPDKVFPSACGGTLSDEVTGCEPACTKDADCAGNDKGELCDTTAGACVECKADTDCKGAGAGVCDAGTCVECKDNSTCGSSEGGKVCTSFGICGCAAATDCAGNASGVACIEVGLADLAFCGCNADADCANSAKGKMCDVDNNVCAACLTDLDCTDPKAPSCTSGSCVANNKCTGDDTFEDGDDGLLGAIDITPTGGDTKSVTGHSICGLPSAESDNYKFTANDADSVTLSLEWTDTKLDLDIIVYDAQSQAVSANLYKSPAVVELSYLPKGTYYVVVNRYDGQTGVAAATPYTLNISRTNAKCTSLADCAKGSITALELRGSCNATTGVCEAIDGQGKVAKGGACDDDKDCTSGRCAETQFNEGAARYAFCTVLCTKDSECAADQVCTTFYKDSDDKPSNICIPKCTKDSECPSFGPNEVPTGGATWAYLTCDTASGKCSIPPEPQN